MLRYPERIVSIAVLDMAGGLPQFSLGPNLRKFGVPTFRPHTPSFHSKWITRNDEVAIDPDLESGWVCPLYEVM